MDDTSEITEIQISDYENYIYVMEYSISKHKSTATQKIEQLKHIDNPNKKQILDKAFYHDFLLELDESYTLILRKSLFITLYSFMEVELQKIARKVENQNFTNIKINDISHRGIRQYHFYLETVLGIEINISQKERNSLLNYNTLRNYFVHNNDTLIKKDAYNRINSLPGVTFKVSWKGNQIFYTIDTLEEDFNQSYLDLISRFFKELYIGLEKKNIKL